MIDMRGVLRRNVLVMAGINAAAAGGLLLNVPGPAPSLAFLGLVAPLPVWAVVFLAAAAFQTFDRPLVGHTIAVPLWLMLALGAVVGLIRGVSTSPSASVIFAGLVLGVALHHINAMAWRRREQRARRDE